MNKQKTLKSILAVTFATGLAATVLGCAGLSPKPDFYFQKGAPHTMTYQDKTGKEITVADLNGKWETKYRGNREVVNIVQKENWFEGYKTIGNAYIGTNQSTISGSVEGNLVNCRTHWDSGKITYFTSKLYDKANEFECQGMEHRKYKRIE